jgi:hypothetical protein
MYWGGRFIVLHVYLQMCVSVATFAHRHPPNSKLWSSVVEMSCLTVYVSVFVLSCVAGRGVKHVLLDWAPPKPAPPEQSAILMPREVHPRAAWHNFIFSFVAGGGVKDVYLDLAPPRPAPPAPSRQLPETKPQKKRWYKTVDVLWGTV